MLDESTTSSSAADLSDRLETIGATVTISSGQTNSSLNIKVPSEFMSEAMAITAEKILAPRFDPTEFNRVKTQSISRARAALKNPSYLAATIFNRQRYGSDNAFSAPSNGIAEELEHIKSDELAMRLDEFLGFPKFDPHGDPIPDPNLVMPQKASIPLSTLRPPQATTIERVNADNAELLRYLQAQGLVPGSKLEVRAFSPFDGNLTIFIGEKEMVVGPAITRHIFVQEKEDNV